MANRNSKSPSIPSSDRQYRGSRAKNARGPARRDFDDKAWRKVQLPHDFVCENESGQYNEAVEQVSTLITRQDGWQRCNGASLRMEDGRAQALIRSRRGEGPLVATVEGEGMEAATLNIEREKGNLAHVPAVESNYVTDWTVSKLIPYAIDEQKIMKEHRIERWEHVDTLGSPDVLYNAVADPAEGKVGLYPAGTSLNHAFHACSRVPEIDLMGKQPGLHFEGLDGIADIYVTNGKVTCTAHHPAIAIIAPR